MEYNEAKELAEAIKKQLAPHCIKIKIGGSIRRKKGMVKDIEIICIPKMRTPARRTSGFTNTVFGLGQILKGKDLNKNKFVQIRYSGGAESIKIDLFITKPENWGMFYLVRTGSAEFSHYIFTLMNKKGYSSKEGTHYHMETGEPKTFKEEQEIFDFLGIPFVEPENRK